MGFKDTFVGLLNYAMAKEVPIEDEDYEEDCAIDFDESSEYDFDGDSLESVGSRSSFRSYSKETSFDDDFDDFSDVEASENEAFDGEDEIFMSKNVEKDEMSYRSMRRYSNDEYTKESSDDRKGERKVVSMNNNSNLKVFLSNPTAYEDCQDICSRVRAQMTVVVNLEKVKDQGERRRIFDFMSGCSYALDCNFEKISDMIYIIAPCHVDIFEEISDNQQDSQVNSRRGVGSFSAILN